MAALDIWQSLPEHEQAAIVQRVREGRATFDEASLLSDAVDEAMRLAVAARQRADITP